VSYRWLLKVTDLLQVFVRPYDFSSLCSSW